VTELRRDRYVGLVAGTGTAVVIGASMGGLLMARVLTDAYHEVYLVDRDPLPSEPTNRRGVPQDRQLHVLLARGREALDELFPGLSSELSSLGAPLVDLQGEVHWYNDGYRMRRASSTMIAVGTSRPLLEHTVRARVAALPGVRFLPAAQVVGLEATADGRRITGVRLRSGEGDHDSDGGGRDGEPRILAADLVVDAGGRGSRTPAWLVPHGYRPPVEEQVQVDITYVTRQYQREPHHLEGLLGALTNAVPGSPRVGIVAAQEGGRFAVAFSGLLGERPPTDDEGLAAFAGSLPAPHFAEVVRSAVPLGEPAVVHFPASRRRRYERLRRFPDGLLVVADALCVFNPIYGQGMTVAALEALLLRRLLTEGTGDLAPRFFRAAARLIDAPWSIAVGTDLRFPQVRGRRSAKVRFVNAYVHQLHAAAASDPELGAAFLRVINLIDPPTRLLRPAVVLRVMRGYFRRRQPRPALVGAAGPDARRPM
jgi:2-polyprenyl-6-methoxyphenol hydroxylase-like FAD-dependent oxidoreductase